MESTLASWRLRALAFAERRLPALTRLRQPEALPIHLDRRRIYVLPTAFGLGLAALLFVMLVGALNYANNAAVLFTCLFASTAGASVFAGFRAMSGLQLVRVHAGEAHAGDALALELRFDPGARGRASLRLQHAAFETAFALSANEPADVAVPLATTHRGWIGPGRVRVWSDYPFGLFRVWSWLHPDVAFLVYPALERSAPPLPAGEGRIGEQQQAGANEEHAGLRDYRPSDPPRLIAWKASVRHDSLLVRDVERYSGEALTLDYAALRGLDREARISRLAAWVVAAEHARLAYTLRLPHETTGPGLGADHLRACLRALALMPADAHG
ncbi:DUF58 domain-containing protein [Dokdonella fugitiva]|jgi:uncharacterized protein (DUF58 family)|uniref:Uncharacterized protein DUF58 n=1 Tax=Dokdonella fugitiva TaxID=328517 RepID=A0A4R2HYD9_9GAMM|nr:DUF58 domain-containing protein [Dokdonella fugitiva]TCO36574.1 uncharacterized protein DUF58 [Dokdonella fugitiva]